MRLRALFTTPCPSAQCPHPHQNNYRANYEAIRHAALEKAEPSQRHESVEATTLTLVQLPHIRELLDSCGRLPRYHIQREGRGCPGSSASSSMCRAWKPWSHGASRGGLGQLSCATGRSWSSLQATEHSNGPMFLVKYCNLTSLDYLLYGGTRLSHVPPRLAIRRIPNLVHSDTVQSPTSTHE